MKPNTSDLEEPNETKVNRNNKIDSYAFFSHICPAFSLLSLWLSVVTVNGVLIHKSGLMSGGLGGVEARAQVWNDKAIEGNTLIQKMKTKYQ